MSDTLLQSPITSPSTVTHTTPPHLNYPTIRTVDTDDSPESFDANPQSSPTSVTQSSNLSPPQGTLSPLFVPSHRRANSEIVYCESPLVSDQQPTAQSRTLDDLEDPGKYGQASSVNNTKKKLGEPAKFLADWFHGKSDPVNLSAFRQFGPNDTAEMEQGSGLETRRGRSPPSSLTGSIRLPKRQSYSTTPLKQVTTPSRFSFFGLRRQEERKSELPEPADDELLNLDIGSVLSPTGSGSLSPEEEVDAVRKSAEDVLKRLQAAYKQRTFALHELLVEKSEGQEEVEEARVQSGNLKAQLNGMAEKALQQEKAMKAMAEEFEQERQAHRKEDETRTCLVVPAKSADGDSVSDLGADRQTSKRRVHRTSNCTFTSDSGFESGDESIAESVFSRRDGVDSPGSLALPSPNMSQVALSPPGQSTQKEAKAIARPVRQSAYDRVLKGLTSSGLANSLLGQQSRCTICHGVPASEAWTVLGILKEENSSLKERMVELENAVDDCLCVLGP